MTYGDDADEVAGKETAWINVRPGMAVEIECSTSEYRTARPEDEIEGKLTGRVRILQKVINGSFWMDPVTGTDRD